MDDHSHGVVCSKKQQDSQASLLPSHSSLKLLQISEAQRARLGVCSGVTGKRDDRAAGPVPPIMEEERGGGGRIAQGGSRLRSVTHQILEGIHVDELRKTLNDLKME